MLILTRRPGEDVVVLLDSAGTLLTVRVLHVHGQQVKLGVDAPRDVAVWRREIWERMTRKETTNGNR